MDHQPVASGKGRERPGREQHANRFATILLPNSVARGSIRRQEARSRWQFSLIIQELGGTARHSKFGHPHSVLCSQQFLSASGLGHKRVTAAERKRRQRNFLPHLKIFFCKNAFHRKGYPLSGVNRFWAGFWERGHEQFSESNSPPYRGGRVCRRHIQARLRCAEPCQFLRGAGDGRQSTLISPEVAEPVG